MEPLKVRIENILGFENLTEYRLTRHREEPPLFLLEAEEEKVSFLLTDPFHFFEYTMTVPDEVQEMLHITSQEDILALVIVRIDREQKKLTANLLGPLVFNLATGEGKQLILSDEHLSTKQPLPIQATALCLP